MKKFGYVLRLGGDPEISAALAEGIREATPAPDPVKLEADRNARAWIDQQRLKRCVGNHKSAEDYALMTAKARGDYTLRRPGPIRTIWWQLIGLFALFLDWEERSWGGEA